MIMIMHYGLRQQTRRIKMRTLLLTTALLLISTSAFANSISEDQYITKNEGYIQIDDVVKEDNGDISLNYSFTHSANTYPEVRTLVKDAEGKLCLRQVSKSVTTIITRTKYITITERQDEELLLKKQSLLQKDQQHQ